MTAYILFFVLILLCNIMQGITGFAGTVLAMPFSLQLVGYPVAKPVLNVLGLLSGIYVFAGNRQHVNWRELRKIVVIMGIGMAAGILVRGMFAGKEQLLYLPLGLFIIAVGLNGLRKEFWLRHESAGGEKEDRSSSPDGGTADLRRTSPASGKTDLSLWMLPLAGLVHGIFVSGGPVLIGYLTKRLPDKTGFRATISTVWIILNGLILLDDIRAGFWTGDLMRIGVCALPFLLAGMKIGSVLYSRMNQRTFMVLTYVLLMICGGSLLVK